MSRLATHRTTVGALLVGGLVPGMAAALVAAVAVWVSSDRAGSVSALVGGLLALAVLTFGLLARDLAVRPGGHLPVMAAGLGVFALVLTVTAAALWVVVAQSWVVPRPLGIGFIVTGIAYQVGSAVAFSRSRVPTLETELPTSRGGRE